MLLRRVLCHFFSPVAFESITRRSSCHRFLEFSRDTWRRFGSWGKSREPPPSESKRRHKRPIQKTRNLHYFTRRQPYNFMCFKIARGRFIFRFASSCATSGKVFRWLADAESAHLSGESTRCSAVRSAGMSHQERADFYRQEVSKTTWEVPERYRHLSPVGSGAYGSVW